MAGNSAIEWTDATWNPIVGCTIVSPGCTNCYAMKDAWRKHHIPAMPHYHGLTKKVNGNAVWTGNVAVAPDHILTAPLRWRKPKRIFVNSMGDLFHESISDEAIDRVFAVMALCPQHTFQLLTKRAERMRVYFAKEETAMRIAFVAEEIWAATGTIDPDGIFEGDEDSMQGLLHWPLPNVWLGISAERQKEADERIPHLLATPAAVRFVSAEPLLGPIDFVNLPSVSGIGRYLDSLSTSPGSDVPNRLDWIIVGGESGQGAREHDIAWSREIIAQCKEAGVSVFEKQLGSAPYSERDRISYKGRKAAHPHQGFWRYLNDRKGGDWSEWPEDLRVREFPEVRT